MEMCVSEYGQCTVIFFVCSGALFCVFVYDSYGNKVNLLCSYVVGYSLYMLVHCRASVAPIPHFHANT